MAHDYHSLCEIVGGGNERGRGGVSGARKPRKLSVFVFPPKALRLMAQICYEQIVLSYSRETKAQDLLIAKR